MGNILCCFSFIKWDHFYWLLPWNRLGWTANLYNKDWNEEAPPPKGTNEYDMEFYDREGSKATFAMGSFMRAESRFGIVDGVIRTRLGYTGGVSVNPTYYNRGDHVEAVDVEYDPSEITYKELLIHFWNGHDYTVNSKKHPSKIFFQNKQQEVVARISRQERQQYEEINLMAENPWPRKVRTRIKKGRKFWPADPIAQKYTLSLHQHLLDWVNIETTRQLIWSTLAMRINSVLMGEIERNKVHDFLQPLKLPEKVYQYIICQCHYQEHHGAKTRKSGKQRYEEILI
ncbi:Peptide methionine sulfoxide reductase [Orchesella cincta]|uniref:peptide-methionine (S)-S-oxide reductase n=1 Tax=Orchesella cincta TaxID=48709 RepID=A0A1D2N0H8_ORCCI|nr:Peptide methionine sulfoxide reductase [Orchesella cincta]